MRVSSNDKPARNGNAGPTGPGKPKPGVNQTQTGAAKVLSLEHKPPSTTGKVLPLKPSTPPSDAHQQVAAYEPWGWRQIVMPHLGAQAHQRYVHFAAGSISVSEQKGAGLDDKVTYSGFCKSVAAEIMRGHPASGIPPQERLNLHMKATEYSHVLAQHILHLHGPHVSVSSFMTIAKLLKKVSGLPVDELRRACDELVEDANPGVARAAALGKKEAMDVFAIDTATSFLECFRWGIASFAILEAKRGLPAPKPFGLDKLTDVMSGLAVGQWDDRQCLDMLQATRSDVALSAALLEHTSRFVDTFWEPDEDNAVMAIYTHTAAAGVILSLSPDLLDQLILDKDDVVWLQRQVCVLLGYMSELAKSPSAAANELYGVSSVCAGPSLHELSSSMDRTETVKLLVNFGQRYMEETHQGKTIANRLLAPIPMLRHNAERREALARVEERLQEAFPDEDVNFEGECIEELLTFFVPRVAQGALTWQTLQSTAPQLAIASVPPATPSTTISASAASLTVVASQAPTDAPPSAQAGQEEFSMDLLRAQWQRFKDAKAQRTRPQAQPDADKPPESKATSPMDADAGRRSRKQPGSKPETSGYEHRHDRDLKALPAAVRRSRIAAMTNRDHKYTANDRVHYRQTKHKPGGDVKEVN